jgi:tetratricopeptide (TPR) repeat protein
VLGSAALVGLALFCTVISGSRAGWIGLALGLVITGVLWLVPAEHRSGIGRILRSRATRIGLIPTVVALAAIGVVALPGVLARAGAGGETLRLSYFQAALRMFGESPLVGTGPGTWIAQRIAYTDVPANDVYIPHAHDVFLQTLAEYGLLGAIAGMAAAFFVGRLILRAIRSGDRSRVAMGWAAVLGLTYFGGHQLLDFYPNMPAALFAMAIPIAWLDSAELASAAATPVDEGRRIRKFATPLPRAVVGVAGIGLVTLAVGWLAISESRAATNETTVALMDQRAWQEALEPARAAAAADPDMPPYQFTLGLAAANTGHSEEAVAAFQRAALADDLPESWLGMAAMQAELHDNEGAHASLERALRLGVVQPAVALASGQLYARLGDPASAREAFLSGALGARSVFGDLQLGQLIEPVMTVDELAADALDGYTRVSGSVGSGAVEIALEVGDRATAESLLPRVDQAHRALFSLVIPAWFGDAEARASLVALARAQPLDIELQNWSARVATHVNAPVEAVRYFAIANIDNGLSGLDGQEIRLVLDAARPAGDGTSTTVYGLFTYRRPTPWNMLPETVVGLTRP